MEIAFPRLKLGPQYLGVTGPLHTIDLITLQVKELVTTYPYVRTHRLANVKKSPNSPDQRTKHEKKTYKNPGC